MATDKARLCGYIDDKVLSKAKVLAALEGVSLSVLVERCLSSAIEDAEKNGAKLDYKKKV